jgi:hypothetical protein
VNHSLVLLRDVVGRFLAHARTRSAIGRHRLAG